MRRKASGKRALRIAYFIWNMSARRSPFNAFINISWVSFRNQEPWAWALGTWHYYEDGNCELLIHIKCECHPFHGPTNLKVRARISFFEGFNAELNKRRRLQQPLRVRWDIRLQWLEFVLLFSLNVRSEFLFPILECCDDRIDLCCHMRLDARAVFL